MGFAMLMLVLAINGFVGWLNARSCGQSWVESKSLGGWVRLLVWCGAIQSALAFSSIILVALIFGLNGLGYMPPEFMQKAMSLWYVLIIVPALGTGILITIESWVIAYRDRSLLNMGGAAYNTFAMAHNIYGATQSLGSAFGSVKDLFGDLGDSDDVKSKLALLAIAAVIFSLVAGALLTRMLILKYAGTRPLPQLQGVPA